jgi:hypothetical protein
MPPHLGRLAQAKAQQAVAVADAARRAGFRVDVSTRVEDSFLGKAWFDFLASCKFTVGMKGGASLHDPVGLLHTKVQSYTARHPKASFDEIEAKCFPGKDMKHTFTAVSPRLFESALAGTCQILQRDDYLGVLEPWRDYMPLEVDFSNMSQIIAAMRDLDQCQEVAENSRKALVDSGVFDYARLVEAATEDLLGDPGGVDVAWQNLRDYLGRSRQVAEVDGLEMHDACAHLIYEQLGMLRRADIQNLSDSSTAAGVVIKMINDRGRVAWLVEQVENFSRDPLTRRAAWIWRPLLS